MKKLNFGAIPDKPDERDIALDDFIAGAGELPEEFSLRDEMTPVKNQGKRSTCFAPKTKILMEDFSYKEIGKIKVGEFVITPSGNIKKVTKKFQKRWQGGVYKIKAYGLDEEITATKEHPFLTKDGWKQVKDLTKSDWVAIPKISNLIKDKTIYQFENDPDFLWVLGLYIAEGSLGEISVHFTLSSEEEHFAKKIKRVMRKFGADVSYRINLKNHRTDVSVAGKKWREIFQELGGKYCDRKRIDKRLMFLDPQLQMSIFEGWKDGDGCFVEKKNVTQVSTTSYVLVRQMQHILLRNSIRGRIHRRTHYENRLPSWELSITESRDDKKPNYRGNLYYFDGDNCYTKIRNVEKIKQFMGENVYNLEIEDDHTYIVETIAVHNCNAFAASAIKEFMDSKELGKTMDFSEEFLYNKIKQTDVIDFNYEGAGSYMRSAVKALTSSGVCRDSLLPYDINASESNWKKVKITESMEEDASLYRTKSYAFVGNSVEAWKRALFDGRAPFLAGIKIYGNYTKGSFKGEIPTPDGEFITGHAICVVGWNKTHFIFKNSWGSNSGDSGYWYLPYDFVGLHTFSCWSILDLPNMTKPFSDIPDECEWAFKPLEKMKEAGILEGYPDGTMGWTMDFGRTMVALYKALKLKSLI